MVLAVVSVLLSRTVTAGLMLTRQTSGMVMIVTSILIFIAVSMRSGYSMGCRPSIDAAKLLRVRTKTSVSQFKTAVSLGPRRLRVGMAEFSISLTIRQSSRFGSLS